VLTAGTYGDTLGSNAGVITVRFSGAGATLGTIGHDGTVGFGQSQLGRYSIPAGQESGLHSYFISVEATQTATFALFIREDADIVVAPFGAVRSIFDLDAVTGTHSFLFEVPIGPFPGKSDIWWAAKAGGAGAKISIDFELVIQ